MTDATTTAEMRRMLALRWRQRDIRGVWFWGSWLLTRWHVLPISGGIAGVLVGYWIAPAVIGLLTG